MKILENAHKWPYQIVDWTVENAENVLIRATPLLSPLPSAFALVHALESANWYAPWMMGGVIEAMGIGSGALIGHTATHNKRHPNHQIDQRIGYGLFAFYFLIAVAIIGGYETLPIFLVWWEQSGSLLVTGGDVIKSAVPLLFPGLTLIGAIIVALNQYMKRADKETEIVENIHREEESVMFDLDVQMKQIEVDAKRDEAALKLRLMEAKQLHKLDQKRPNVSVQPPVQSGVQSVQLDTTPSHRRGTKDDLAAAYRSNPTASYRQLAAIARVSKSTVPLWLDELKGEGRLNGGSHK